MKKRRIATVVQLQLFEAIPKFVYLHKQKPKQRDYAVRRAKRPARDGAAAAGKDTTIEFLKHINFMS